MRFPSRTGIPSEIGIMNITIVGSGYVGLVTEACLAQVGHHVICVDNNEPKVADADLGPVNEFIQSPNHFDGRNQFDRRLLVEMGFDYYGIGR
jgi:glycine/D-amino acid oxidase-like deaminating enzyme